MVFCRYGIISELRSDFGMQPFSIHNERSMKDWDGWGSSLEGCCQLLSCEYQAEVLGVDTGIVAIPLFNIDVPLSSKCTGLVPRFLGGIR